jgi:hypothetical protein
MKTEWYNPFTMPVRSGVYERRYYNELILYCYWTGQAWRYGNKTIAGAVESNDWANYQFLPWRGLVEVS